VFNNTNICDVYKDLTEPTIEIFIIFPEEPFISYMSYARNGQGPPLADRIDLMQSSPVLTVALLSGRIRALVIFKTTTLSEEKHNILAILLIENEKAKFLNFEKVIEDFFE
jgi:hypothetical protein